MWCEEKLHNTGNKPAKASIGSQRHSGTTFPLQGTRSWTTNKVYLKLTQQDQCFDLASEARLRPPGLAWFASNARHTESGSSWSGNGVGLSTIHDLHGQSCPCHRGVVHPAPVGSTTSRYPWPFSACDPLSSSDWSGSSPIRQL